MNKISLLRRFISKSLLCAALAPWFIATHTEGATITWSPTALQVNASDPSQISSSGTAFTAVAFSSSTGYGGLGAQTVGGVTFNCAAIPAGGNTNLSVSANAKVSFENGGTVGGPSVPTAYTNLSIGGIYNDSSASGSRPLVLSGLTVGQMYQFQAWSAYWNATYRVRFSDTAPTLAAGVYNSTNQSPSLLTAISGTTDTPQYALGTFIADATTQNIYWYGEAPGVNTYSIFGAFQVRAVPTPTPAELPSSANLGSSPAASGSETYDAGTHTYVITAVGAGTSENGENLDDPAWGDRVHFTYKDVLSGDYEVAGRVVSYSGPNEGQVGLTIRSGLGSNDEMVVGFFVPGCNRTSPVSNYFYTNLRVPMAMNNHYYHSESASGLTRPLVTPPFWVKMVKVGQNIGFYWSPDGRDWLQADGGNSGGVFFPTSAYKMGFFVASGSASVSSTATIDNVYVGAPRFKYKTSWVGSTSAGVAAGSPSNQVYAMWVKSDGTCYANSNWDEDGMAGKIYKDGAVVHGFYGSESTGVRGGWEGSVTGNGSNLFVYTEIGGPHIFRTDFTTANPTPLIFATLGQVRGMAASASTIFVSDYENGKVRAVDATTLTEITTGHFPITLPLCGPITFDGTNFWVIQAANHPPSNLAFSHYTVGTDTPAILCFQPDGTALTAKTITWTSPDKCIPTALAYQDVAPLNATSAGDILWVCDNSSHQYIRKYNNLNAATPPTPSGTPFGVDGGIWNGSHPGQLKDTAAGTDKRFYGPVGIGTDSSGYIYVACNGGNHFTTDIRKFNSAGTLQWRVNGGLFCQASDFDPTSDGQQIYSPDKHFTMNYTNTAPGSEWSDTGYTRDITKNADEARNHASAAYQNPSGLRLARLGSGSKLYMYMSGQGEVGKSWLYYFNGETAVPYGTNALDGPAPNTHRIWTDKNLNGIVDGTDPVSTAPPSAATNGTFRSFDVDSAGNIWMSFNGSISNVPQGGMREVIYQGTQTLDNGTVVPKYDLSLGNPAGYVDYFPPPPLFSVYNVNYDKTNDVLYAVGIKSDGNWALVRADKWTTNPENRFNPTSTWSVDLPLQNDVTIFFPPPGEFYYSGLDVAGIKIFVAENYGPVHVYDTVTGNPTTMISTGPELSGKGGWLDMTMGLNAVQRSSGEYVITEETTGIHAADLLYRWTPTADTVVSAAPTALTATAVGGKILLKWTGPSGGVTSYNVYRSTASGTETLYQSGMTSPTFTDLNVPVGSTYYYKIVAVNAAGVSAQSNEAYASPTSNGVEFVKTDTATQGTWYTGTTPSISYVYGSEGYEICAQATSYPGYASVAYAVPSPTPAPPQTITGTWVGSTTDGRALRKPGSATDRIAAYRQRFDANAFPFSATINVGSGWHQVALYLLDWPDYVGAGVRGTHQVTVYDPTNSNVLDYRRIGDFTMGKYLVWNVTGTVRIEISQFGYQGNTVMSGLFFDPVQNTTPTIGWWKMDDTGTSTVATDSSGAGRNGTRSGGSWNASGKIGGCINIPGGTAKVTLPNGLITGKNPVTFSAWIKTSSVTGAVIADYQNAASSPTTFVPVLYVGTDGKLHGTLNTGVLSTLTSAASVNNGAWHHVALVGNGNVQTLYVDGVVADCRVGTILTTALNYNYLGYGTVTGWPALTGTTNNFNGYLDDVRLDAKALTPAQVWQLANP